MSEGQNPFLLPLRPAGAPAAPAAPDAVPAAHPVLPPPVGPPLSTDGAPLPQPELESGTHRVRAPRTSQLPTAPAAAPGSAMPAFFPAVPGTQPPAPQVWRLEVMDGTRHVISGPTLFGRDPVVLPEQGRAELVPIDDPRKSVSKTHALVEPRGDELVVTDLGSTNGTSIVRDGARAMVTGAEALAPGDVLMLGNVEVHVTRE